ncbi:YdbL family protein [Pelomicrobium sp.]|jgi:uncharacterized protein YdbL (DUF1318 family)|uniref:YdbL family protein n=1 Tax=Pelomicrobium sp. TaxID=2815319 RepID=UPI002FDCDBB8
MKHPFHRLVVLLALALVTVGSQAQMDLEINTPAIAALKESMQKRHAQLAPHYASGAVGLTQDGLVALRDANAVPLPQRAAVNALITAENQDRLALYREIARANGHPEWEQDIRATFAQRWIDKAQPGWWYRRPDGTWARK